MSSKKYSDKQFENDLRELQQLINNNQDKQKRNQKQRGGDSRKQEKREKHDDDYSESSESSEYNGPHKNEHSGGAETLRTFRVHKIDGKPVGSEWSDRYYHASKASNHPGTAALKAYKWICVHLGRNKYECRVQFEIVETTRGSKGKVFGPYEGRTKKVANPKTVTRVDPKTGKKKSFKADVKRYVELIGDSK